MKRPIRMGRCGFLRRKGASALHHHPHHPDHRRARAGRGPGHRALQI